MFVCVLVPCVCTTCLLLDLFHLGSVLLGGPVAQVELDGIAHIEEHVWIDGKKGGSGVCEIII